jgi:hypothetical protein
VTLLSPATVAGPFTFTAGRLVLGNQLLTFGPAATITGASPSRYLVTADAPTATGYVLRPVPADGTAVDFPVGTPAGYAPVVLTSNGPATTFRVRTFGGVMTNGTSGGAYARTSEFVNRSWEVLPATAGAGASLTLQWNQAEENTAFQRSQATIFRNDGPGLWNELPTTAVAGTDPYSVLTRRQTTFGVFSVGNGLGPLPVQLVQFDARRTTSGTVLVSWTTATELNNARFEVEKSVDGRGFGRIGTVKGQGTATTTHRYSFPDAQAGPAYYRLRQVDTDGRYQLSPVAAVAGAEAAFGLFPNPTTHHVQLTGDATASVVLQLTTLYGQELLRPTTGSLRQVNEALNAALPGLPAGVYVVTVAASGQRTHLRLVKQ